MTSDSPVPAVYVAGLNQSKKQIIGNLVKKAYVASDADQKLINTITALCESHDVVLDNSKTKEELGIMCEIDVNCAVCVELN